MSVLDDLLEEVKAVAKNEALTGYENRITGLEAGIDSLQREVHSLNIDRERWRKCAIDTQAILDQLRDDFHNLTGCNER